MRLPFTCIFFGFLLLLWRAKNNEFEHCARDRPSCDQALRHKWLTNVDNLKQKAAEYQKRKLETLILPTQDSSGWRLSEQIAFVISVFVILGSYTAMITYVFNIGKPSQLLIDFINHYAVSQNI